MNQKQLDEILDLHKKWLNGEPGGRQADLSGEDLSYLDFSHRNCQYVQAQEADFLRANCQETNFQDADFRYVKAEGANFEGADCRYVKAQGADFLGANFQYVKAQGANFEGADCRYVKAQRANFEGANFQYVNAAYIKGYTVISVQINTSRKNNMVNYWVELDVVTTGCFQGTLKELKEEVETTHKDNDVIRNRYHKAIEFIEFIVEDYKKAGDI